MGRRKSRCGKHPHRSLAVVGFGLFVLASGASEGACESLLTGSVTDAVTGTGIVGAKVEVVDAGQVVGTTTTDARGAYTVAFNPTTVALHTVSLQTEPQGYAAGALPVQVNTGGDSSFASLKLYPSSLAACLSQTLHKVVVGVFRPPLGQDLSGLADRVVEILSYDLNTQVQAVHLATELQPIVEECAGAEPHSPRLGGKFAAALGADAFVFGFVEPEQARYRVTTYISDAYGMFTPLPRAVSSPAVDLGDSRAVLSGATHAAILGAVAKGLADAEDWATAISVISAAEHLVNPTPDYLLALRKECEKHVPNAGLVSP
jgi:hypothetical protein